jgi:hypothetical protein
MDIYYMNIWEERPRKKSAEKKERQEEEDDLIHEMRWRLEYEYSPSDIDLRAYRLASVLLDYKIVPKELWELVNNRDALRPDVRRFLQRQVQKFAERRRKKVQKEISNVERLEAMADQLAEPKNITPSSPLLLEGHPQTNCG